MRGPAPSIVCPRCDLAAPPSDMIAPFTTCTRCGLSFDARAKERAVRPTRPPRPPEPAEPPPRAAPNGLRGYQVVGILAVLLAAGAFKWQYSWRYRDERERIEEMERSNRADDEHLQGELAHLQAIADTLKTGIASCDALMPLARTAPLCASDEATAELKRTIATASATILTAKSAAEMDGLCTKSLAEVHTAAQRLGCQ